MGEMSESVLALTARDDRENGNPVGITREWGIILQFGNGN